jgi:hypothetical protein
LTNWQCLLARLDLADNHADEYANSDRRYKHGERCAYTIICDDKKGTQKASYEIASVARKDKAETK